MLDQRLILALSIAFALGGAACSDDGTGNTSGGGSSGANSGGTGASGPGPSSGSAAPQTTTGAVDPTTTTTGAVDPTTTTTGAVDPSTTSTTGTVDPSTTSTTSTGMVEPKPCDASVAPDVGKLALEAVVANVDRLVYALQPPGSDDWYLVQQTGTIRVFSNGALRDGNFLDVSSQIQLSAGPFDDERGLLGLAFPPDYATSGKFYIMMTPTTGDYQNRDVVIEYTRSSGDPYKADPASAKPIVELPRSEVNHNGGHVLFGPDGMLYVGTGDGGGSCSSNQPGAAQDVKTLFGKILRLDPKAAAPEYAASGNPFAADGDARVLHYGVRNPYRFSFDRATGDLYIGDVGQNDYEEVDFAPADAKGLNFGWPKWEGLHQDTCRNPTPQLRPGSTHTPPIVEMDRRMGSTGPYRDYVSVIGGPVYRGSALPQLQGVYLFGDYRGERMGALVQCGDKTSPVTNILKNRDPNTPNTPAFTRASGLATFRDLTAIVEDHDGEIYFVANRNSLWKVVPGQ